MKILIGELGAVKIVLFGIPSQIYDDLEARSIPSRASSTASRASLTTTD